MNPNTKPSSRGPNAPGSAPPWNRPPQRYAVAHVVPEHVDEIRSARQPLLDKTRDAVQDRLTKEISHWDRRAEDLKLQEQAGRTNARLNSAQARQRADRLQERLHKRLAELELERQISPRPPVVPWRRPDRAPRTAPGDGRGTTGWSSSRNQRHPGRGAPAPGKS